MTKDNHAAAAEAAIGGPRKGRHVFVVNAGRDMLEFEIEADDFEVASEGVHFVFEQGKETEHVGAFVSHPCIVRQDDAAELVAKRSAPDAVA